MMKKIFSPLKIVLVIFCINFSAYSEEVSYLLTASAKGDMASVRAIIESGGNPNTKDKDLVTALMYAARKNQVDVIKFLILNGANVNAVEEDGWTALMYAAKKKLYGNN